MRDQELTGRRLLLAGITTAFSAALVLITAILGWEFWMVPLLTAGILGVWFLHIWGAGSESLFENLCVGLLLTEFFFFGVHAESLFDIPTAVCVLFLVFSSLGERRLLYITAGLYAVLLAYHALVLRTLHHAMGLPALMHVCVGFFAVCGSAELARRIVAFVQLQGQQLRDIRSQLQTIERQNAVFLSNVSHEFRTPINMVLGLSEVLLEKDLSPSLREDVSSIQMAGRRLSGQIGNILDYTEIVEGSLVSTQEEYRITSVLYDVLATAAMQGGSDRLEIVFDLDPAMPSILIGDSEKLSHVLKILVENAIKFTEDGGIRVAMSFRRESYGVNLMIDIFDTGIGMTASQLSQISDDFYQADAGSSRLAGGLGLGIPIARGLLHAMGGFVHFESREAQGLQIRITIPQGVADAAPCMTVEQPQRFCIACYFRPERYGSDEVRRYYDSLIVHMVEGLGLEGYQAHNFESLLTLQRSHALTHVFIAQTEYEENRPYYEDLAQRLCVVVIAERNFALSAESRLLVIRKPFSALSVVNILNGESKENGFKEAQAVGEKPFRCTGVRVLAVDDEEMNLVVAKGMLGSYGIEVDTCLSGREAVRRCGSVSYDVIFLDHMMPGFDGVETLRHIRALNNPACQEAPVIALTANTISGAREMFHSEGFTEFIPKPIERAVLERVLRKVLPPACIEYSDRPTAEQTAETAQEEAARMQERAARAQEEAARAQEKAARLQDEAARLQEQLAHPQEDGGTRPQDAAQPSQAPRGAQDGFAQLAQAGVNVQLGLDYCCGQEDFYREMLRMFRGQYDEKRGELVRLYEAADWKDYAIKAHALKSTALTIGAEALSEQAKALELAGKRGDEAFIRQRHGALLQAWQALCACIGT